MTGFTIRPRLSSVSAPSSGVTLGGPRTTLAVPRLPAHRVDHQLQRGVDDRTGLLGVEVLLECGRSLMSAKSAVTVFRSPSRVAASAVSPAETRGFEDFLLVVEALRRSCIGHRS